jgi:hypothetical protein
VAARARSELRCTAVAGAHGERRGKAPVGVVQLGPVGAARPSPSGWQRGWPGQALASIVARPRQAAARRTRERLFFYFFFQICICGWDLFVNDFFMVVIDFVIAILEKYLDLEKLATYASWRADFLLFLKNNISPG